MTHPENLPSLLTTVSDCDVDVTNWMTQNKLLLNADTTETMLVGFKRTFHSVSVISFRLGENHIPLSLTVKSFGVILDNMLSMQKFISRTCQSSYYQLRRDVLTPEAAAELVTSVTQCRLGDSHAVLSALPASSLQRLHRARKQLCCSPGFQEKQTDHVTPVLAPHFTKKIVQDT